MRPTVSLLKRSVLQQQLGHVAAERKTSWRRIASLAVACGIVGLFGAAPAFFKDRNKELWSSDDALSGSQIQRGMYLNTGSRDIGPDPDWDLKTGTYRGRSNFQPTAEQIAQARANVGQDEAR
jgi:hypothetical protein